MRLTGREGAKTQTGASAILVTLEEQSKIESSRIRVSNIPERSPIRPYWETRYGARIQIRSIISCQRNPRRVSGNDRIEAIAARRAAEVGSPLQNSCVTVDRHFSSTIQCFSRVSCCLSTAVSCLTQRCISRAKSVNIKLWVCVRCPYARSRCAVTDDGRQ